MNNGIPDFRNSGAGAAVGPVKLPPAPRANKDGPEGYLPDAGLADAMRVATILRRPLLLTGEPGTGKSKAADYMCWRLGHGTSALKFEAKSTSTARDLLYTYNTVGRFLSPHIPESSKKAVDYITYNPFGIALIRAVPLERVRQLLPENFPHAGQPTQSVVLIDEIDKAPRDFPNDVLNEIEHMFFRIPEFGNAEVRSDPEFTPVLIITSNSEKNLPPAFLRRCIYYDIPRPDKRRFGEILVRRLGVDPSLALMNDALDFLVFLREKNNDLRKAPSTSELLDWVMYLLGEGLKVDSRLSGNRSTVEASLSTLIKDEGKDPGKLLDTWLKKSS